MNPGNNGKRGKKIINSAIPKNLSGFSGKEINDFNLETMDTSDSIKNF